MTTLRFKNNASTTLSGSINDTQTSITVVNGATFPVLSGTDYFYATLYEESGGIDINIEIVKVTATGGSVWTIERGQDGTTARSRDGLSTCYVEQRYTAAAAQEMLQKNANLSDLQSTSTARANLGLGSMATQSAAAVAITGGTISGVAIEGIDSTTTISDNADNTKKVAFEVSGVTAGTTRTLTVPNASGTLALLADLVAGYQPLDSDLTAIAALSANGLLARTATGAFSIRTISQPAAGITVTNGDGVSGNPTLALANDLAAVEALSSTGFVRRTAADTWTAAAIADGDLPGALTGKTYNALTLTSNATGFSVAGGTTSKTLSVSNSITLAGTDGTTITLPSSTGTVPLNNQTFFIGTTQVAINRSSGALSLAGVSIDGSAGSATTATTATRATNLAGGNATTLLGAIGYQSGTDTTTLLGPNTSATKQFLSQTGTGTNGAAPTWSTLTKSDVGLANVEDIALSTWAGSSSLATVGTVTAGVWNGTAVGIAYGGTGAATKTAAFNALSPNTTLGDLSYHDGTNVVRLPGNTSSAKRFLRQTGTGTISAAPAWDSLVDGDIPSALTGKTYNALSLTAATTGFTIAGGSTSKTLTVSNTITLAGTDSSTLNIGAGGTLGSAAFTSSSSYVTSTGSASISTVGTITTGTWAADAIGISSGGTGATSKTAGYNALTPITTLGDIVYGDGANSAVRLPGNTTANRRFLRQTGTGTVSAAPAWDALVDGDLPSALAGKTYNGLSLTANAAGFQVAGGTTSKTLIVSNSMTLSGNDGSTLNIGAGGTLGTAAFLSFAAPGPIGSTTASTGAFTELTVVQPSTTTMAIVARGGGGSTAKGNYVSADSDGTNYWTFGRDSSNGAFVFYSLETKKAQIEYEGVSIYGRLAASLDGSDAIAHHINFRNPGGTQAANWQLTSVGNAALWTFHGSWGKRLDVSNLGLSVTGALSTTGDLSLSGSGLRIKGDFSNATLGNRLSFQTTDVNGTTAVQAIANGTGTASYYVAFAGSDSANAAYGWLSANASGVDIYSNKTGTGAVKPVRILTGDVVRGSFGASGGFDISTGVRETKVAMGANDIDTRSANYFTKTITGATTFTVSNTPAAGTAVSFILELTNGGSSTITWWTGVKWPGGAAPTLTVSGVDILSFYTHDGGTTWRGNVVAKDSR